MNRIILSLAEEIIALLVQLKAGQTRELLLSQSCPSKSICLNFFGAVVELTMLINRENSEPELINNRNEK